MKGERGFALIAVLLVLAVLGVVGAEFAFSMRLEASAVRAYKDRIIGSHLAEAAVEQAIREIVPDYVVVDSEVKDGERLLTFYEQDGQPRQRLPHKKVRLGGGEYSYTITDEQARLNLNTSRPERIDQLLRSHGIDKSERDVIVASLQDWRDANEEHRLNGAESDDTYLKLPVPYRARNANLESVRELLQVKGVTPALFYGPQGRSGTEERRGLVDDVTVKTPGPVNIHTASEHVKRALGLSDAEITATDRSQREGPYMVVPGQFGGRGFVVSSQTFRIEAEGVVADRVGARVTAIVQRRQGQLGPTVVVLEWWEGR